MQDFFRYIPHTGRDCREMLDTIGIHQLDDLFNEIPCRLASPLYLPDPLSESDLIRHFQKLQPPVGSNVNLPRSKRGLFCKNFVKGIHSLT